MHSQVRQALSRRIAVARGREPADVVLTNGRLIDVLDGETRIVDIALTDDRIAGVGADYEGRQVIDLGGRFICPGFIDAHVHLESSLLHPREFARAVVPHGVTTVVSNPHEIANVLGAEGIRFMFESTAGLPLQVLVTLPACVPATGLATAGGELRAADLRSLAADRRVVGLGEVMDFPGVLAGDARVLEEIASFRDRPVDGHCPGLSGRELDAYAAAGICSEHECTTAEEAREKLRRGLRIFIREGSAARNLTALLPLVTPYNERFFAFCTDDRQPRDLLREGSIDHLVRMAIAAGLEPLLAIRLATLNAAEHFRLADRGAIAPGRRADLVVFSDLAAPRPELVFQSGREVAGAGLLRPFAEAPPTTAATALHDTVHIDWRQVDYRIPGGRGKIRVIGIIRDQLVTEELRLAPHLEGGLVLADTQRDLLKMAVIERHRGSGRIGLGFVQGFGLQRGAVAGTVAHDHHNLVAIGADDISLRTASIAAAAGGGGLAAAEGETVLARLPLPLAGLMAEASVETVRDRLEELQRAARDLGSTLTDPFATMSFLALEVIPALKLTDRGLVDVTAGTIVPLFTG